MTDPSSAERGSLEQLLQPGMWLILVIVMVRLVPETKGRTLEELERIWKR